MSLGTPQGLSVGVVVGVEVAVGVVVGEGLVVEVAVGELEAVGVELAVWDDVGVWLAVPIDEEEGLAEVAGANELPEVEHSVEELACA
ncbi:hypothetical protein FHU41_000226 [Psychromicrobium silvestre]|uniref:Uncharacterized protein n=1 Tax=Psychromicrobium silvestre TaxID=1645614 RepID=A0A7Y9LR12_9MICC|nr:hypothetical protein [Psychromicrobium silvestre]NYE94005.1 hypothetical protein [Psychromicrobium silvestre]